MSRGPWFREDWVEEDGLDYFYCFLDNDGKHKYLLSNNVPVQDRERIDHLYQTMTRNHRMTMFAGMWLGFEIVCRQKYLKSMALGWRFVSTVVGGLALHQGMQWYSAQQYAPILGAFFRKYSGHITNDLWEIKDEKKAYFYIDTSQYMNVTNAELSDEYHANHGPQPEGDALNSSYLSEVDAFLRGEENNLKGHKRYLDYEFEFIDKSFPTAEKATDLMHSRN